MTKQFLTQEGLENVNKELHELKENRKRIANRLEDAIKLGDLSENAEYHDAKEAQGLNEARIRELEEVLNTAEIIQEEKKQRDTVTVGSTIEVRVGKEIREYTIVGSQESDPTKGLISNESPIGESLLGCKVNESVDVETPGGRITFTILKIKN